MDLEKSPQPAPPVMPARQRDAAPEGCLTVAVRIPVRIVVFVLIVPVRMAWDALVVCGRLLDDTLFRPLGRALMWVLAPVGRALVWLLDGVATLVAWLFTGLGYALKWLCMLLFVWPWVGLWRYVAVPVGRALAWLGPVLLVVPARWLYERLLTPLGHGIVWTLRGLGAGCAWLWRMAVLTPAGWLYRALLAPTGRGVAWVAAGLWSGLVWVSRGLWAGVVWIARGLWAGITWVGGGLWAAVTWVGRGLWAGMTWVGRGLWAVVVWLGKAVGTLLRWILVVPAVALWRWVLAPVGRGIAVIAREIGEALGHAWRVAGHVSLAVGRFLGRLLRWIFVEPVRWAYGSVLTPMGHFVRDVFFKPAAQAARSVGRVTRQALTSARETARQTRADIRRALFGAPREPGPVPLAGPRSEPEPVRLVEPGGPLRSTPGPSRREHTGADTRTLGSSTTALTKD
ncbi:hypothetical protein ACIOKD_23540 [Streptomyces sp. NPDC087844]|uniref:hypothetical protein n=1 Tax=Streptomyces sp. NPDC087844 TaxID=3365805 RepID=UPI00380FF56B